MDTVIGSNGGGVTPEAGVVDGGRIRSAQRIRVASTIQHALVKLAVDQLLRGAEDLHAVEDGSPVDVVVVDLDADDSADDTVDDSAAKVARGLDDRRVPNTVVGLTANVQPEWITRVLRTGVAAIVSTLAPPDELLRAIRTVASGEMYFDPRVAQVVVKQLRTRRSPATVPAQRKQFAELSEREQIVLRLVAEGHTGPEIGRLLGITAKTVDTYRHRIQEKIGLSHRRDYIHFALRIGLLAD